MRSGAALPAVLLALALTSALAVGGAHTARRHASGARESSLGVELRPLAEAALVGAVVGWDSAGRAEQGLGSSTMVRSAVGRAKVDVWITRVSASTYWIVAESVSLNGRALRRRVGVVVETASGTPRVAGNRAWLELP